MLAQQVEAGGQAAEHAAGDVAAVEEPSHDTPSGVAFTQREIAGSVAPIITVGGSRQMPAAIARRTMPATPPPAHAV